MCVVRYFYYDLKINNLHNYYSFLADINECLQNPCSNSVTCQNVPGSYTCVCNSGWTGQDCDIGEFMANSVIWLIQMCDFEFVVLSSINCFANMSTYVGFITNIRYQYGLTSLTRYQRMFAEPL